MVPIFYTCYKFGAWLLNVPFQEIECELSFHWLSTSLVQIWQPFLLGCFAAGGVAALLSNLLISWIWRLHVWSNWKKRRELRKAKKQNFH